MEKKKEYLAPEMEVVEYVVQSSLLLEASPNGSDKAGEGVPEAENVGFD